MTKPGPSADHASADRTGFVVASAPRSVALVRRYTVDACAALGWGDSADTEALAVAWGADPRPDGKTDWFEIGV